MNSEQRENEQIASTETASSAKQHAEETPRKKPLVSRLLKMIGVNTGPAIDWIFEWIQILIVAGLLAWFVMSFATVRMSVPTGSMIPTIEVGDSFFVDKLTYLLGLQHPEPGDVVVFWRVDQTKYCQPGFYLFKWGEPEPCRERFVKRLVAIGPAEVQISQGNLFVDGVELSGPEFDRDYVCDQGEPRNPMLRQPDYCRSFIVPEGKFFVLGDNTWNSSDSRVWGTVNMSEFIGEPFLRVWPTDRIGPMNGYFGSAR